MKAKEGNLTVTASWRGQNKSTIIFNSIYNIIRQRLESRGRLEDEGDNKDHYSSLERT